jgi:hypothetical protein
MCELALRSDLKNRDSFACGTSGDNAVCTPMCDSGLDVVEVKVASFEGKITDHKAFFAPRPQGLIVVSGCLAETANGGLAGGRLYTSISWLLSVAKRLPSGARA